MHGFNIISDILPEEVSASKTEIKMHPHQYHKEIKKRKYV
jgi:hypothetical protein